MYLAERNKYVATAEFIFDNKLVSLSAQWYPGIKRMYFCFHLQNGYEQGSLSKRGYSTLLKNISNDTKTQFKVLETRKFEK